MDVHQLDRIFKPQRIALDRRHPEPQERRRQGPVQPGERRLPGRRLPRSTRPSRPSWASIATRTSGAFLARPTWPSSARRPPQFPTWSGNAAKPGSWGSSSSRPGSGRSGAEGKALEDRVLAEARRCSGMRPRSAPTASGIIAPGRTSTPASPPPCPGKATSPSSPNREPCAPRSSTGRSRRRSAFPILSLSATRSTSTSPT